MAEGFVAVVGNEDGGRAALAQGVQHFAADFLPQVFVERTERFVKQNQLGFGREGAGEGDALLLAARKLVGEAVGEFADAGERHHGFDALPVLRAAAFAVAQAVGDVAVNRKVREQHALLHHIADAPLLCRQGKAAVENAAVFEPNFAAVGLLKTGDGAQQGGFAAA